MYLAKVYRVSFSGVSWVFIMKKEKKYRSFHPHKTLALRLAWGCPYMYYSFWMVMRKKKCSRRLRRGVLNIIDLDFRICLSTFSLSPRCWTSRHPPPSFPICRKPMIAKLHMLVVDGESSQVPMHVYFSRIRSAILVILSIHQLGRLWVREREKNASGG